MDKIATIAASLHGVDKDTIYGADIKEHRKFLKIAWGAAGSLLILVLIALALAAFVEAGRRQSQYNLVQLGETNLLV